MFPVFIDYATPSSFESERDRQLLGLTANRRRPVRFHARVAREIFPFRLALQALGEVVWSDDSWLASEDYQHWILDPVITVHPDRVFFEAFSQDQSAYGLVIADRDLFETDGEVQTGTTNVDFTGWLWAALAEMRSSRETWLRVEPAGFEVKTTAAGGRFEAKVELPDHWVRGFLQLQAAMALPGTRVRCRPVDLLAPIRYLRYTKAKVSPRAMRYEFPPGEEARLVLEPFEEAFPLRDAEHNYEEFRAIRTWGRRRLRLLEPLLPYADDIEIYLKGRALPSFYAVRMPGLTFVLGLSGWTSQRWTGTGSFDLLVSSEPVDEVLLERALQQLGEQYTADENQLVESLGCDKPTASRLLAALCRRGLAIYDVQARSYRHRELFEAPIDEDELYPPDPRREAADQLIADDRVRVDDCSIRETRKQQRLKTPEGKVTREVIYRDWVVNGTAGDLPERSTEIVVNDTGRIIFGTCACPFFQENLMNQGPCEHMLALFEASSEQRKDLPSSVNSQS
ncbi:SWIM zinc finger protein [Maioricimonas rarisocia]|uniref:SWIM zinc finger protein n=1 Tax=Maioricimonas rarisocia TaxID=2528026 RepID=A0A517Z9B3_9PLAN|nr:SWIM zinc finger family protein [Maioricimonas rarisocia]QDU39074.1 SWIM zinc finger protein [Maioricimonas rarisocia]